MMTDHSAESHSNIINSLLQLFLHTQSRSEFLDKSLRIICEWASVANGGIRVMDAQGNIPYASYIGFNNEFIKSEAWLSTCKDNCACTRVALGQTEPQDSLQMTPAGSFCCNDTNHFIESLTEDERSHYRGICILHGFKSLAVIPIRYGQKILGAIHLADGKDHLFPSATLAFLESSVASLIGEGIYRFNVEEQLEHNLKIQTVLTTLLKYSLEDLTLEGILNQTLDLVHSFPPFSTNVQSGIFLVENEPNVLVLKASRGFDAERQRVCARTPFGQGVCGNAALKTEIQYRQSDDTQKEFEPEQTEPHCSYCISIQFRKVVLGVISIYLENGHHRDQREEEFLTAIANTLAGIIWRKYSEDKLRALSRRLVTVQEEERRAIALELHDQIGQMLTGLKLMVSQAARSVESSQDGIFEETQSALSDLIVKVREMSLNLRPSMLDDLGLLPTLIWHFQQLKVQSKLEVDFHHSGLERKFSKDVSIAAYRIIQEALTNIIRYAGVSSVTVNIWADDDNLHIVVEDRGKGFKTAEVSLSTSVGLQGMKERAILLGGSLSIDSKLGSGTIVFADLPLQDKTDELKMIGS